MRAIASSPAYAIASMPVVGAEGRNTARKYRSPKPAYVIVPATGGTPVFSFFSFSVNTLSPTSACSSGIS